MIYYGRWRAIDKIDILICPRTVSRARVRPGACVTVNKHTGMWLHAINLSNRYRSGVRIPVVSTSTVIAEHALSFHFANISRRFHWRCTICTPAVSDGYFVKGPSYCLRCMIISADEREVINKISVNEFKGHSLKRFEFVSLSMVVN